MNGIKNLEISLENYTNILQKFKKKDFLDSKTFTIKKYCFKNIDIKNNLVLDTIMNIIIHLGTLNIIMKDFFKIILGKILYLDQLNQYQLDIFINNFLISQG
ncbi:Flagellar motor switch protein FliN [Buchnera aphidicola (Myzocallis carpini)]